MATTNVKILRVEGDISSLDNGQIGVEGSPDGDLGMVMWGGKDYAGIVTKFLGKDKPAQVASLELTNLPASVGLVTHDSNTVSGDAITLAQLNASVSDATLDDSGDPRDPTAHASSHELSGSDALDVTGLQGTLPDGSTITGAGTTASPFVAARQDIDLQEALDNGSTATIATALEVTSATGGNSVAFSVDGVTGAGGTTITNTSGLITKVAAVAAEADSGHVASLYTSYDNGEGSSYDAGVSSEDGSVLTLWDQYRTMTLTQSGMTALSGLPTGVSSLVAAFNTLAIGEPFTTTTDTPIQLTAAHRRRVVLTGSGKNVYVYLPDATTLAATETWTLVNSTTEFVVAMGYGGDTGTFAYLAPGGEARCTVTSIASAAGVWTVVRQERDSIFVSDLVETGAGTAYPLFYSSLAGGTAPVHANNVVAGRQGWVQITTSTSATGRSAATLCVGSMVLGSEARLYDTDFVFGSALSTAAEEYSTRIGFGNKYDGTQHTAGIWFEYDRLVGGDFIMYCSAAGGTVNQTVTAVVPAVAAADVQRLSIVVASDSSRADFWINKVHVGTLTTGIPSGTGQQVMPHAWIILKSAGTTSRASYIDKLKVV